MAGLVLDGYRTPFLMTRGYYVYDPASVADTPFAEGPSRNATCLDLIMGALRSINAYAPGEVISAADAEDAKSVLNDMLDTWSTEQLTVYNQTEGVFSLESGKHVYTVGNPVGGSFLCNVAAESAILIADSFPSGIRVGSDISGPGILPGTTVVAVGVGYLELSKRAFENITGAPLKATVPGDLKMPKPLRINSAFTRISRIDFPCETVALGDYAQIGLKRQPGPWPKAIYYNQGEPLGTLSVWPVPTQAGEMHIWADSLYAGFDNLTDPVQLSPGYVRAIKKNLALELAIEYGKAPSALLVRQALDAKAAIKAISMEPQATVSYDAGLVGRPGRDAGWILHGGFR